MNSCLSYRDERIKNGVASPPLSIIVAIVIPSLPFVRCGKNQWRGPRPAKGRGPLFRSIRLSDRQNDGVDIGARVGERPYGQIVPFHPAIGGAALLDDPMKGTAAYRERVGQYVWTSVAAVALQNKQQCRTEREELRRQ